MPNNCLNIKWLKKIKCLTWKSKRGKNNNNKILQSFKMVKIFLLWYKNLETIHNIIYHTPVAPISWIRIRRHKMWMPIKDLGEQSIWRSSTGMIHEYKKGGRELFLSWCRTISKKYWVSKAKCITLTRVCESHVFRKEEAIPKDK